MEFIMTYGWAILVVLVAIGALAYFGVLNPTQYLPEKCVASAGFSCRDHRILEVGTQQRVLLTLENKQGSNIQIKSYNVTQIGGTMYYTNSCTSPAVGSLPMTVVADSGFELNCTFGTSQGKGQSGKYRVLITYQDVTGVYDHVANVEVQSRVQ